MVGTSCPGALAIFIALVWTDLGSCLQRPQFAITSPKASRSGGRRLRLDNDVLARFKQRAYDNVVGSDNNSQISRRERARRNGKLQEFYGGPFPCANASIYRSAVRPNSVHRLMPGDIQVVAAMGDSLTAGMGATAVSWIDTLIENRGFTSSIGGFGTWRDTLTLPNILKVFNPHIVGYSTSDTTTLHGGAGFNLAEPGAISSNMLYQAKVLVERIRKDRRVDFSRDWKLVTVLIGNNDVCSDMCFLKDPSVEVDTHYWSIRKMLDHLRDHLPRTFVNVLPIINMAQLPLVQSFPSSCYWTHTVACPCFFGPRFRYNPEYYTDIIKRFQQATIDAVEDGGYGWRYETFAAVIQPYQLNVISEFVPSLENKYQPLDIMKITAPDCNHYNQLGYALSANSLWNNMLQPVHEKERSMRSQLFTKFECPNKSQPYFFTKRNNHKF